MKITGNLRLSLGFAIALLLLSVPACGETTTTSSPAASSPTPAGPSTSSGLPLLAALLTGHYSGNWTNTTFGSTGTVAADISIDSATQAVTTKLAITGSVFGGSPPPPQTFTGRMSSQGTSFTGTSPTFGAYTVTIAPTGAFTMHCPAVPGGRVKTFDATGTVGLGGFTVAYNVTLAGGSSAKGTAHLAKG